MFALSSLLLPAVMADEITLVADPWCPYNCQPEDAEPGFLVELATTALQRQGHSVTYRIMPWLRAIAEVQAGTYTALLAAGPTEVPGLILPSTPQAYAHHTLFTLPDGRFRYEGADSLAAIVLGAVDGYSYGTLAGSYIEPRRGQASVVLLRGQRVLPRLIDMLRIGRIDAFVEDRAVLRYFMRTDQTGNLTLREAGTVSVEPIYIAFSPAVENSGRYIADLQTGIRQLEEDGTLATLERRYGISRPGLLPLLRDNQ